MKYIDADKLIAEIDKRRLSNRYIDTENYENELLEIIDSLQQEQPIIGEEYTIEVGKHTHTLRVGSQSDIDNLIRQEKHEQPEVDLEKEINACWRNWLSPSNQKEVEGVLPKTEFAMYARHFYEFGKNARKEE